VSVATTDDTATESTEAVLMNLSAPTGGTTLSGSQGTGSITDNDTTGSCTFAADRDGTDEFTIYPWVERIGTCSGLVTINYSTQDATAIAGTHYDATSGSLVFQPGDSYQTFPLPTIYPSVRGLSSVYLNFSISLTSGSRQVTDSLGKVIIFSSD
jgi:hypothetical protein